MVKVKEDVSYCDLCEQPTGDFHYYEVTTSALGVISERTLMIDLCKSCAKKVQHHLPEELMQDRYDSAYELPEHIEEMMNELKVAKRNAEQRRV